MRGSKEEQTVNFIQELQPCVLRHSSEANTSLPETGISWCVPGTPAACLSPPHPAGTGQLWGTGREALRRVIPSTGTPMSSAGGPEKCSGSAFALWPQAQTSSCNSKRACTGPSTAATTSGSRSHPGCSGRDHRLQLHGCSQQGPL